MAVARFKLTAHQFRVLAASLPPDLRLARRELLRAAERPGLRAELRADEVRAALPFAVGDAADALAAAAEAVTATEQRERQGAAAIRSEILRRRQAPAITTEERT